MRDEYVKEYGFSGSEAFSELIYPYFEEEHDTEALKESIQLFKEQIDNAK